jgi:hypothetical protein
MEKASRLIFLRNPDSFLTIFAAPAFTLASMKPIRRRLAALACLLIASQASAGDDQSKPAVETVDHIQDKVRVGLGDEWQIRFREEGDRLVRPEKVKATGENQAAVGIELKVTDATPFPVEGVATRPYLVVTNGLDRAIECRALARLKGSRKYFEISVPKAAILPGENAMKCWESGSTIEEIVLYDFTLVASPSK